MRKIECPDFSFDDYCPYLDEEGYCRMEEDCGCNPFDECDAFCLVGGLTFCPNCGAERFNDELGFCLDCGYDEKEEDDE